MPINYENGIIKEHKHVRNYAGIFDVSHMGQILISSNSNNITKLEKYIPLDLENMPLKNSKYSFILNKEGGIVDDIIISKLIYNNEKKIFIVYNASRKEIVEKIFNEILTDYNLLTRNCLLAVQGPLADKIISNVGIQKDDLLFMNIKSYIYNNESIIISRTGYTGEDGFELSIPNSISENFIDEIIKNNKEVLLCGLGSRDSLRLEAGLSLYGNELNETLTPVDAGLLWAINKNKLMNLDFYGSNIISNQIKRGSKLKKIGVKIKSKSILRSKMEIINNNKHKLGYITSGGYSPSLDYSIGLGYLYNENNNKNIDLNCLIRGNLEKIEIVKLPFIKHNYLKG
tara:strand:- start:3284 stop:4312 length:1029 start_codon:yes stop_codon:yes gene_type:complete